MEEHYLPIQPEFAETLTDNYGNIEVIPCWKWLLEK